jgi:ATP-dependent DNA helicase RecG
VKCGFAPLVHADCLYGIKRTAEQGGDAAMKSESLLPGVNLESRNIEFKGVIREGRKSDGSLEKAGWLKTLVAFANTDGGTLYIGVEDKTHKVVALDHQMTNRIILMIHRQIRGKIAPKLSYEVDTIPVTGDETRYIIRVRVDVGKELPVTLHERGLLGIYVRNYGCTETATPEQIRNLILMSEQIPYDQPFTDKDYREEDFEEMFELARKRDVSISEKQLISIGFISPERKLSKGALLFMDRSDTTETQTTAALWPDFLKGSDTILAHGEWKGNLLDIIRQDCIKVLADIFL